jgi:hypothetical protein
MEKLNFNKFTNLSQKDKKTLTLFNHLLSKKFPDFPKDYMVSDLVNYLFSKFGKKIIHPVDVLNYIFKLKHYYDDLTAPEDTKFWSTTDSSDMGVGENFLTYFYFQFFFKKDVTKSDTFFVKMMNCFNDVIKLERRIVNNDDTGERWEEGEQKISLRVDTKGDSTFPVIANINSQMILYISIDYEEGKNQIKVKFDTSSAIGKSKEYYLPVFWDDIRKIDENDFFRFICKEIKPEFLEFVSEVVHENIHLFNKLSENKNILKNKEMTKIIKLTENDIENIIQKIIESKEIDEGKKNVPTNPKLWKQCLAWARSRYKVCPSAYCNGAAAKRYKSKGGKWRKK